MATTTEMKDRTKDELYELARERDIAGRSDMDKEELDRESGVVVGESPVVAGESVGLTRLGQTGV